jgi:hypothetical protein
MQADSYSPTSRELRELRRNLAAVTDAQLMQVVALIDGMAERGRLEELIAPLRARLGQVRPPRPLHFTRLLFLPLDPVIVPAPRYRAGMPAVPRTALIPLSAMVRAALGPRAAQIDAAIEGRIAGDAEAVQSAGELLWQEAALILTRAPLPPGWAAAGLPPALYPPLARAMASVLEQAEPLQKIVTEGVAGLPVDITAIDTFLARAAAAGPEAWSLVLAVLLARLPTPDAVLRQAIAWATRHGDPVLRASIEPVLDAQLACLEAHAGALDDMLTADLATAGAEVQRIVGLLDGFSGESVPAMRRKRAETIRQQLDASCRTRFSSGLAEEFVAPLQAMLHAPAPDMPPRLEVAARQLRALETQARRLGSAPTYDELLHKTAAAVQNIAPDAGLQLADKVRLVEILIGPEAALSLLD